MLFTPSVTYLLAVCAFSSASPFLPKRSGYSGALYAYGTEIGGSAVYFIDGKETRVLPENTSLTY